MHSDKGRSRHPEREPHEGVDVTSVTYITIEGEETRNAAMSRGEKAEMREEGAMNICRYDNVCANTAAGGTETYL